MTSATENMEVVVRIRDSGGDAVLTFTKCRIISKQSKTVNSLDISKKGRH